MKIYTKTGDRGMTSLIGGERVSKTDSRVEAYGSVDELSAFTALLADHLRRDLPPAAPTTTASTATPASTAPATSFTASATPTAPSTPTATLSAHVADLTRILSRLMEVEALLAKGPAASTASSLASSATATPSTPQHSAAPVTTSTPSADPSLTWLEGRIDAMQAALPPIDRFTLPGGHPHVSLAHVCRTVCRRAERAALRADAQLGVDPQALAWLNRLSDYFYLLARSLSAFYDVEEILWNK